MTLKDIELTESNHFVAMEYYMLVLNRTYLILLINNKLIGLLGNGLISLEAKGDIFSSKIANSLSVRGDLRNPHSYLKEKYIRNIENINLLDGSILKKGFSNFIIDKERIKDAWYDPSKKWGMGYYPHDGKVYIKTNKRKTREFIILGNQSGADIVNRILPK
ncbi:MAG: hypothetical protein IPG86_03035 [Chitinophagaceae bacterium]|nr:hypothetical protein [Chitinophagaceae bacterium]